MSIAQVVTILQSAVFLALLLVLVLKLWPSLRLDTFRQRMFVVRDELFDYAASGKIAFNDPAYRLLRQSMNGFIRYAHQLTFFRLCLTIMRWRIFDDKPEISWALKWERALVQLGDENVINDLRGFHTRALSLVIERLVSGSPVLLVLLIAAVATVLVGKGWHNLKQLLREAAAVTVARIVDPRLLEEEASRSAA
jgi:hypothetical protein